MTNADRLLQINRWYDDVPEIWQTHIITWPLVGAGFINIELSINEGFPFGLLVLLAIAGLAALRLPPQLGWIKPGPAGARFEFGRFDLLHDLNRLYDSIPELPRFAIFPLILIGSGTLSMWLTWHHGWPFGSVLLLGVLAILAFRLPYQWQLFAAPPARRDVPVLQAWGQDAQSWWNGLSEEQRGFATAVGLGALLAFDLIVTGGARTAFSSLVALELLAGIIVYARRAAEKSPIAQSTNLVDHFIEQWAVLQTLWQRPDGWGFNEAMIEPIRARRRLTMQPPQSQIAAADD